MLCFACTAWGKVSIRGKIVGYDGKSLIYYHPTIEGIYTPYWKEVKPEFNGKFRIEFDNAGYGITRISYKGIVYRFFHDADSDIYFEIQEREKGPQQQSGKRGVALTDSIKQAITVKIEGNYESINRFYNSNLRSSYVTTQLVGGTYYSRLIYNETTPSGAVKLLDSLTRFELDQINELPWQLNTENPDVERKQAEIKEFLVNEAQAFYAAVFLNGMFLKRQEHVVQLMRDSTATPDLYNHDWELLIEKMARQVNEELPPMPNSPDYNDLMESMAYTLSAYKQYDFPQDPSMSLDEMVINKLFNYDTTLFKDERSRFAYELRGLHRFLNDQLFFSPALLHAVYDLQRKYPESENLAFFEPQIEKLKTSLEASGRSFDEAKLIRANYKTFEELIDRFKGKNILVDIWATWCHPCVEDFKYKDQLKPFIDTGEIEVLYISIDKQQWADRWRQSIKINQLAGNHFRANPEFIRDMWKAIGDYEGAIPRYVLIDKEGEIFKSTAARPSQGAELTDQIKALLLITSPSPLLGQPKTDPLLKRMLIDSNSEVLHQVVSHADSFRLQIIYTQINRDADNTPSFKNYYYHFDNNLYFNPASTVKLPLAFLALEKLNRIGRTDLHKYTAMQFDSSYQGQVPALYDSTSETNLPSIAHYIRKAFLVSDNDAYNRLYQFVGQQSINRWLQQKGYNHTRIVQQFMGFSEDQNRHTNAIRFLDKDGREIYSQPAAYNSDVYDYNRVIKVGNGHINRQDSLVYEPIDFTKANKVGLEDLQRMLQAVLFPESVPAHQRFDLSAEDYDFLYRFLSQYPSETNYPKYDTAQYYDSYVKFYFRNDSHRMPPNVRVFNKVGWAYGFLTDVSYVVDFENNVEFMLTATVYVNSDGILNDNQYEYTETGWPFLYALGQTVYQYELKRKRAHDPDLTKFKRQYEKRDPTDGRPALRNVDN